MSQIIPSSEILEIVLVEELNSVNKSWGNNGNRNCFKRKLSISVQVKTFNLMRIKREDQTEVHEFSVDKNLTEDPYKA